MSLDHKCSRWRRANVLENSMKYHALPRAGTDWFYLCGCAPSFRLGDRVYHPGDRRLKNKGHAWLPYPRRRKARKASDTIDHEMNETLKPLCEGE